jgi:4-amino-4-deoxy-L-arabinose transferase-like glycosyltransferase
MVKKSARKLVQNQEWVIVVALSLLVILLRLPSLEQPLDNDGGAIAYHARLIVRGEALYGTHHPAHHTPAIYYLYALAFLLFGDSVWAVKFLLVLWSIAAAYLLYRLGALLMDRATGLLAAVLYVILTADIWLGGTGAEIELFANLPRIAAFLVLMNFMTRPTGAWKFVFVGLLSAFAFLFKAVYLSPLAMAGLVLLVELSRNRTKADAWHASFIRGLWVGVGFGAGLLSVAAYFGLSGLLPRFLLVFTLGQNYIKFRTAASPGPEYVLLYPLLGLAIINAVLLIFSLAALVSIVIDYLHGHRSGQRVESRTFFYIVAWYILSFIEAGITRTVFPHYYLLIVPPLTLLAARVLLSIYRAVKSQAWAASHFAANLTLALLLTVALFLSINQNFNYYYRYVRYKLGLESYQGFLLEGQPAAGPQLVRLQKLANYIQEHTSSSDYIYYWSGDVQLYYLSDRRCPVDIIWPLYAEATGSYQRIFVPQTKYVILGDSFSRPRPDWLYTELAAKYTLENVIDGQEIYRRVDYNQ